MRLQLLTSDPPCESPVDERRYFFRDAFLTCPFTFCFFVATEAVYSSVSFSRLRQYLASPGGPLSALGEPNKCGYVYSKTNDVSKPPARKTWASEHYKNMVDHNNKKLAVSYIHQLPTLDFNTDPNVLQVLYNTSKSALEKIGRPQNSRNLLNFIFTNIQIQLSDYQYRWHAFARSMNGETTMNGDM